MNPSRPLRLAVAGCNGKMGRMILEAMAQDPSVTLATRIGREISPDELQGVDCLIDFTRPEATLAYARACQIARCNLVVGTTGLPDGTLAALSEIAAEVAMVVAPNMSLGVNVTMKLVEQAARSLGMDADIEVFEAHHKMKVDAPSGTALKLAQIAASARGQQLDEVAAHNRSGARRPGDIGFSVVRAGEIIGDHTVFFALAGERIEITHRSSSRTTYAQGAIRAAKFLSNQRPGLFDMRDVLALA